MSIILKEKPQLPDPAKPAGIVQPNQQRRLLVALALLLMALVVVLLKQPPSPTNSQSEVPAAEPAPATATPDANIPATTSSAALPADQTNPPREKKVRSQRHVAVASQPPEPAVPGPMITATNRTVLPPLQVEVVAGNQHRPLSPANNSVKVEMQSSPEAASPAPPPEVPDTTPVPSATTEVTIPPTTAQRVTRSVEPKYPVLARQMKVQGAVVLQALIDRTGHIEELKVISGPSILASAAQQALRQWHFKPYFQGGQAVETEARVTVNFTISTY